MPSPVRTGRRPLAEFRSGNRIGSTIFMTVTLFSSLTLLRRLQSGPADFRHALAIDLVLSATRDRIDFEIAERNKDRPQVTRTMLTQCRFNDFSARHDQRIDFR